MLFRSAKTLSGAAKVLLIQEIKQESTSVNYGVLISYGHDGNWVPLNSEVLSSEITRLIGGQYLLSAIVQVKSEVVSSIRVPSSSNGRDLAEPPIRVVTRILLDSAKTQILAQAVYVVEKVSAT